VLKAPYRTGLRGRRRTLTLYILIEHQSEPDALMVLRVLEYLVQIYNGQVRSELRGGRPHSAFRLQPVLPVVLYTGERRWEALMRLAELVQAGDEDFADVVPQLRPLFLSLSATPLVDLEASGGALGWVLELLHLRGAAADEFRAALRRVVDHLAGMAQVERERWLLLLSCIDAMIYHDRAVGERPELREMVRNSAATDPLRREVEEIMRTGADALRDEGRQEERANSRRQTLLRQLRLRFGRLPRPVEQVIRTTNDVARLDAWLDAVVTAETLADMGIPTAPDQ
jgi:hypothetical protein